MSAKGGITKGKSHAEGGIPMVVKSTGQQVELEGGEGVINKRNMASDTKFEFQGKQMTTCEIASAINSANGNGVQIDCDDVTGKKYAYENGGVVFIGYKDDEIMYEPIDRKYYANDKEFDSLEEAQKFLDSGGINEDLRGAYERGLFKNGGKILNEVEEQSFKEWMTDGNVAEEEKDVYSTQDSQYRNRLKGMDELRKYFRKEFLSDSYEGGGGVGNVHIALSKTKNGLLLSERFDKQITHKQLFDYYKKKGYEIIDSNIFKVTNKGVLDVFKDAISKFIKAKYNELVDWQNTLLSYKIVGDRIIAQSCFVQTKNGNEHKITPNDLVNKKFAKGGWLLINADTERIIKEYDTESEARQMSYEYDGDSFVMEKSELEKEKSRETYRPPAPLNPATYIGMERGGSINVEKYNFNELRGKYVNLYSMGVELPTENQIVDVTLSSPQFRYRYLTLKFDLGNAQIKFNDIEDFLNGEIVLVKTEKEEFGVQLIPNQFAKGGRTKNAMKTDDYENASLSMDSYEDGAISSNPTEFAKGGITEDDAISLNYIALMNGIRKSENTFEQFKRKLIEVIKSNDYRMPTAKAFEIAYEKNQFAKGGGVKKAQGVEWMKSDGQYEAELGFLYLIISPSTERGLYNVRVKEGYRGETIGVSTNDISGLDNAKDLAYDIAGDYYKQFADGGGISSIKVGDEVIWKGNKYLLTNITSDTRSGFYDKKYFLSSNQVGVSDAILDSLKDVKKYKYAKGGGVEKVDNSNLLEVYNLSKQQKAVLKTIIPILNKKGLKLSYGVMVGKTPSVIYDLYYQDGILNIPNEGFDGEYMPTWNDDNFYDSYSFESLIDSEDYAKGGIVEYVDSKRTDKNYFFLRYEDAIGSFAWIYNGKYNEGILYPLDDFDKEYYSHIPLKSGEKLYRYATEKMSSLDKYAIKPFNNVRYLIKFNLDKGLIYFMSEDNDPNDDKNIRFDTRGTKADYIVIDKERFEQGGGVDSNNYRISISENDKYIGEYHNPIPTITDAKVIFSQLASKYKRPQYLISVSRMPTSSSGYEILNVDEWYSYVEGFANGGDVRDFEWYQQFKKQELKRGTEHEMEHIDTIKKFKKEGVSDKEVAKAIAKDHLDENDSYYIELEKMEENAKQVNDTLSEHEKHKNRKKNIKRFRLGGYMGYRGEMIYIKMKEDVTTDLFNLEGRFYSETTFKKDALIMMSFISNNGYSTKMEIMDTGVYAIIPNVAFELVGYDSTKYGKGGDVKPQFSSVDLSENDKEILSVLRTMNEENATHEQREFISNFRGKNVVNQLSKQVISKVYGLLFEWHNIENPIHNILIENVGAGNMASLLTNSLVKKIGIEFIKDNPYYLIEKKINSIVNSSMTFYDMSSYDLKSLDAIVKVYDKTNPLNDTLVQRLYQSEKKAVAVGVAEFTSETHLNEFKNSVGINMGGFAQNQMFLAKSMNYFVVNEGITDEGKHTLIYGVTKY
jgi:DNA-binding transcriptional MerR regulator